MSATAIRSYRTGQAWAIGSLWSDRNAFFFCLEPKWVIIKRTRRGRNRDEVDNVSDIVKRVPPHSKRSNIRYTILHDINFMFFEFFTSDHLQLSSKQNYMVARLSTQAYPMLEISMAEMGTAEIHKSLRAVMDFSRGSYSCVLGHATSSSEILQGYT